MTPIDKKVYKVSVIVPSYNGGDLLVSVVRNLLCQELPHPFNVLVIDSTSNDGSIEKIKEMEVSSSNLFVTEIPVNEFGHGKTRNYAATLTKSEYIVFLTQDALPVNDQLLKELISPLDKDNSIAGLFGRHLPYSDAPILVKKFVDGLMDKYGSSKTFEIEDVQRYKMDESYRQLLYFFSDNCSILRRSVWEEYPFEDVDYGEDQIWARTILEAGYKKGYSDSALVYHSHNYNIKETYNRAFIDRSFWIEYFDIPSIIRFHEVLINTYKQTKKDFRWLKDSFIHINFSEKLSICLRNFARFLGEYNAYKKYK